MGLYRIATQSGDLSDGSHGLDGSETSEWCPSPGVDALSRESR